MRASPRISRICLSAVPATETYKNIGGFDARGLEVAAVVTTEFVERGRAPCFGKATTKMSGVDVGWAAAHPIVARRRAAPGSSRTN